MTNETKKQPSCFIGWLAYIDIYAFRGFLKDTHNNETYSNLETYQNDLVKFFKKRKFH